MDPLLVFQGGGATNTKNGRLPTAALIEWMHVQLELLGYRGVSFFSVRTTTTTAAVQYTIHAGNSTTGERHGRGVCTTRTVAR